MDNLLCIPLKKGSEIDLVKPLTNTIASLYPTRSNQSIDLNSSINELNKLRSSAVLKLYEKSASCLDSLQKYYDQLTGMELKIPQHEIQIPFKWKDAFDKGNIFSSKISLTVSSLGYEKSCVLFNIGAMQSQLGSTNRLSDSDDEFKTAAKYFQSASGIYSYLRSNIMSTLGGQEPTPDITPTTLAVLSSLMLAQAQEIFVHKAIRDKMKDALIAKLAIQAEDIYAETYSLIQREHKVYWDKEWLSIISGKQIGFLALSNFYQSNVCGTKKQIGEQIGYLNAAIEQFKQCQTRFGVNTVFADYAAKAARSLAEAKKDNDFIYHERIPDTVQPVEKVPTAKIAKPTPLPNRFTTGKDLFDDLVPVPVHQALAASDARKAEMVNSRLAQLREASQLLNSILVSLNLPAALEEHSASTIPQSLIEKSKIVQEQGGIGVLERSINELPDLVQRNKEILDEAQRLIQEEEESDLQLRGQLKEKWTRTPSEKLNGTFKQNGEKYRLIINNALAADNIVKGKLANHRDAIILLTEGENAISSKLPQSVGTNKGGPGSAQAKETLKQLMHVVEQIKAERDELENKLKNLSLDVKTPFLQAFASDGSINEPVMSVEILGQAFSAYDSAVKASLDKQESIVREIQKNSDEYFGRPSDTVDSNSRDSIMRQIQEGYNAFTDLQNNIREGTKFYNDLTQLLLTYQNKVSDFCFARKTEKEELLKDVTRSAAGSGTNSGAGASAPPPRPPPPTTTQSTIPPVQAAPYQQQTAQPSQQSWAPQPPYPTGYGTFPGAMPMPYAPPPLQQSTPYPYMPVYNPYATIPPPQHYPYPVQPSMQMTGHPAYPGQPQNPPQPPQ